MTKHKGAIIGFGGMAGHHYKTLKDYERVEFVGAYDIDPKRIEAAKANGMKTYSSKEELFADPEIEFVLIATTNEVHCELAIEAMESGKHVICEKPVTINASQLEQIIAASEKYNRVFTIDQNRRTNRDFLLMKQYVESGILGEPYVIESRVEGSRGMPTGWRTLKALGGGMMLDWGVHLIDQIMLTVNEKVKNVYCKMYSIQYPEVDDNFRLTIIFENNLTAHIEVSTNSYIAHPRWYVLGQSGTLKIEDWDCKGKIVRCIDKEDHWAEEIIYTKAGPTKTMAPRNENSTETIEINDTDKSPYNDMLPVYDQFMDAIDGIAPLKITAYQLLRVMKVMDAAFVSDQTQTAVSVNI